MRPSEPLLAFLRKTLQAKGLNPAALAEKVGEKRGDVRKVLAGTAPLTVDQLLTWTQALDLKMEELVNVPDKLPEPVELPEVEGEHRVDLYGNQAEEAMKLAFAMGTDFAFTADPRQLAGHGIPPETLKRFDDRMLIKLDAAYHRHNNPQYSEEGVTLTLSFDTIRVCFFPWSSVLNITLFPLPPEPPAPKVAEEEPEEAPKGRPALRLVK